MNEDVKNNEDGDMSKKIAMSLDSSVDLLVLDAKTKLVSCSDNTSTMQQSESTVSVITLEDIDSLSHSSYASKQQVSIFLLDYYDCSYFFIKLFSI